MVISSDCDTLFPINVLGVGHKLVPGTVPVHDLKTASYLNTTISFAEMLVTIYASIKTKEADFSNRPPFTCK